MLQTFVLALIAVFVALDVVGTLPLFVSMTSAMERCERNRTLDISMFVAFAVAVGFRRRALKLFPFWESRFRISAWRAESCFS